MMDQPSPPKFYTRLFRWFCKSEIYGELEGDLLEEFHLNAQQSGAKKASALYRREVVRMIRPSVIKVFRSRFFYPNQTAMIKNYTLVALRNLQRNKLFSAINIVGLSVSMAVALLTIAFATEIKSFDSFHEKADRIWRVNNELIRDGNDPTLYASTSLYAGQRLREEYPGIEKVVSISKGIYGEVKRGDDIHPLSGYYVSREFLEVFDFPLLYGNPATALDEPYSLILTESTARRIFNRADVIGEVVQQGKDQYQVTGVLEELPANSHIKFQAVASMATYQTTERGRNRLSNWTFMWSDYVYVLLPENTQADEAQTWLDRLSANENKNGHRFDVNLKLEALMDIFPSEGKYNQLETVMPAKQVNSMMILTLIVVFCACFNYANLSIARSLKRAKEIGVRKVVGATRAQVFIQFIAEAILMSVLSVFIAYFLFRLIRPEFLELNFYISRTTTLDLTTGTYLQFLAFAIAIGVLAGTVPAILMTRFKPVSILKGVSNFGVSKGFGLRKVLIAVQFTLSTGFAILVILTYKQYNYALNFDLGYTTENILNVQLQGNDPEIMKTALEAVPEVQGASLSSMLPSTGGLNSNYARKINAQDSVTTYCIMVDENYLENMQHELVAGSNFDPNLAPDQMIVNEQLVQKLGFNSAEEALGTRISYYGDTNRVVGVVKDFHYGTVYNEVLPFSFVQRSNSFGHINLRLTSSDMVATMSRLSKAWESIDDIHDFEASFYSESIERTYNDLSSSTKTYGMLAIVAISISVLGLLGMAAYSAEARVKELTIRKVLGATVYNLLYLLSKNFVILITIAACIAIPLSIELFKTRIVQNMEYRIDIGFWELASGTLMVLTIALITIGSQARKAARTNPAETLRSE